MEGTPPRRPGLQVILMLDGDVTGRKASKEECQGKVESTAFRQSRKFRFPEAGP
jgi:DNA primase